MFLDFFVSQSPLQTWKLCMTPQNHKHIQKTTGGRGQKQTPYPKQES